MAIYFQSVTYTLWIIYQTTQTNNLIAKWKIEVYLYLRHVFPLSVDNERLLVKGRIFRVPRLRIELEPHSLFLWKVVNVFNFWGLFKTVINAKLFLESAGLGWLWHIMTIFQCKIKHIQLWLTINRIIWN